MSCLYSVEAQIALREFFLFHNYPDEFNMPSEHCVRLCELEVQHFLKSYAYLRFSLQQGIDTDRLGLRNLVYEAGKRGYGESKDNLKEWFRDMNLVLFDKPIGPQLSVFIDLYGETAFIEKVDNRLINYLSFFGV
jgi:lysyl-tRNA synthetase class I